MLSCNCANRHNYAVPFYRIKLSKINPEQAIKMPNTQIFHVLQPKHTVLKSKEAEEILEKFNVSLSQLPKIKITDPAIPENAIVGDVIKIERRDEPGKGSHVYYRVVVL